MVLESLACGTPVIVNAESGVSEVLNENCGVMIKNPDCEKLGEVIDKFNKTKFNREKCRELAEKYDDRTFVKNFEAAVKILFQNYT